MTARENILGRIRSSLRGGAAATAEALAEADRRIAAQPPHPLPAAAWQPRERFVARARELSSTVEMLGGHREIPAAIAAYLAAHDLPRQAVCWPELADLPWSDHGLSVEARPPTADDPIGITGAFCAVADTGTLMLRSGATPPAAASLLPETHVAIVAAERIVPFMEDAWTLLRAERDGAPRAVNFISGPSRTADVELELYLGAHGPYRVHVIVIGA